MGPGGAGEYIFPIGAGALFVALVWLQIWLTGRKIDRAFGRYDAERLRRAARRSAPHA